MGKTLAHSTSGNAKKKKSKEKKACDGFSDASTSDEFWKI